MIWIAVVAVVFAAYFAVTMVCCCVVAARADRHMEQALRERRKNLP